MVRSDASSTGSSGRNLGYSGITRSIAIEFDGNQDAALGDPAFNHISLHYNKLNPVGANDASETYSDAISENANMNFANGSKDWIGLDWIGLD